MLQKVLKFAKFAGGSARCWNYAKNYASTVRQGLVPE